MFEVGKKYNAGGVFNYVCIAVLRDKAWMHKEGQPESASTYTWGPQWSEYVKPKVKKSGWINIYKNKFTGRVDTGGAIYSTKAEAIEKGFDPFAIVTIEWEE